MERRLNEYSIILVGDSGVGKTALAEVFVKGRGAFPSVYITTSGFDSILFMFEVLSSLNKLIIIVAKYNQMLQYLVKYLPNMASCMPNIANFMSNIAYYMPNLANFLPSIASYFPNMTSFMPNIASSMPNMPTNS